MKIRLIIYTAMLLISLGLFVQAPVFAAFNPLSTACTGDSKNSPVCKQNSDQIAKNTNPIVDKIHIAANLLAMMAAAVAVIIIIFSGFKFATAGGSLGGQRSGDNPTKAKEARASLIGALVGLLIVAFAWSIVTFVITRIIK